MVVTCFQGCSQSLCSAPRWKGPFVVQQRLSREGNPGVTYEIVDPRNPHSQIWIVHHNRLKPYKGTLQDTPVNNRTSAHPVGAATSVTSTPSLTTLSGALPFRPPTPPHVFARAGWKPLPAPICTDLQCSATPPCDLPVFPLFPSP